MPGPTYPIPVPSTWSTGEVVKAPQLRADVTEAVGFLAYRPIGLFANQSGTSQGTGDVTLQCTVELYDNWNGHDNVTNPGTYFCQAPGWYLCRAIAPFAYSGTNTVFASGFNSKQNGTTVGAFHGAVTCVTGGIPVSCNCVDLIPQYVTGATGGSGDNIVFLTYNGSGAAQNLTNNTTFYPLVSVRWAAAISGTVSLPVPTNPSWPVPPTYLTSSFMNTNIRDTINFLLYPPICKVEYTPGTTTLPSQSFPAGTVVEMGTVVVDNYSGYSTSTYAYTAPVAGNYFCYGQINLAGSATGTGYGAGFSVNSGTTQWGDVVATYGGNPIGGMSVTKRLQLNAGDEVQLVANHGGGSAIEYNTNAENAIRMIIVWESTA